MLVPFWFVSFFLSFSFRRSKELLKMPCLGKNQANTCLLSNSLYKWNCFMLVQFIPAISPVYLLLQWSICVCNLTHWISILGLTGTYMKIVVCTSSTICVAQLVFLLMMMADADSVADLTFCEWTNLPCPNRHSHWLNSSKCCLLDIKQALQKRSYLPFQCLLPLFLAKKKSINEQICKYGWEAWWSRVIVFFVSEKPVFMMIKVKCRPYTTSSLRLVNLILYLQKCQW